MSRDFVEATHIAFCKEPGNVDMCVTINDKLKTNVLCYILSLRQ